MRSIEQLQYPIGQFNTSQIFNDAAISQYIREIKSLPEKLNSTVMNFTNTQMETPYRPDGWKVIQVVHHLADSHANAYTRFHLALTEESPIIKPYLENKWAELSYLKLVPYKISLNLLKSIHERWVYLLENLSNTDLERSYVHPEYGNVYSLRTAIALYAWHGNHHLAHITELAKRNFDQI